MFLYDKSVNRPEINSPGKLSPRQPLVLIPVTAEDVARARRHKIFIGLAAALVLLAAGGILYKRIMDPRNAREAYDAGLRLMTATRYEQAALNFSRVIDLKPDFADAYRMRGRVYVAEYRPDPAIQDFTKVIQLVPGDATALVERGFARLDKKDYSNAIADADHAIRLTPKLARAYTLRGTARRAASDPAGALEDFASAIQLQPDLENYFQRASTYQLLNQHRAAIEDFTNAIQADPQQPHIYFARALSESAVGDSAAARQDIAAGRKIDGW
jgi:tetratricopeptide (TPR) repeat protein